MFKKFIYFGLIIIMAFSMSACGNTINEDYYKERISKLETKIDSLYALIENLDFSYDNEYDEILYSLILEIKNQNVDLKDKIEKLEKMIEDIEIKLENINAKIIEYGTRLYSIENAYEKGIISRDHIKDISYLVNGVVYESLIEREDNKLYGDLEHNSVVKLKHPHINKFPETLSKEVEAEIKESYVYELHNGIYKEPRATIADVFIDEYYGTVNNYYIVNLSDAFSAYMDWIAYYFIDGIMFNYGHGSIFLWK